MPTDKTATLSFVAELTKTAENTEILVRALPSGRLFDYSEDDLPYDENLFLVVNAGGACDAEITEVRAHFVDIDSGGRDALMMVVEAAKAAGCPPHALVESSPERYHLYWFVAPGADVAQFKPIQEALAAKFGTDKTVVNPARLMRLPGSLNHKTAPPKDCRLVGLKDTPRIAQSALAAFAGVVESQSHPKQPALVPTVIFETCEADIQLARAALADHPAAIEGSHGDETTLRACFICWDYGLNLQQALPLLLEYNLRCKPSWTDKQLQKKLQNAYAYAKKQKGTRAIPPEFSTTPDEIRLSAEQVMQQSEELGIQRYPKESVAVSAAHILEDLWPDSRACSHQDTTYQYNDLTEDWEAKRIRPDISCHMMRNNPFVKMKHINETVKAAEDMLAELPRELDAWSENRTGDFVKMRNGILDLQSRELIDKSPEFFTVSGVDVAYHPGASADAWEDFLESIWPGMDDLKDQMQLWFGYVLGSDNSQQKIALLIGESRGGKGVISRTLDRLLGQAVATATMLSLGTPFGLSAAYGKKLIQIRDVAKGGGDKVAATIDVMRCISGNDPVVIERKHKDAFSVALKAKIMMTANELPGFADSKGALANRLIVFPFKKSFAGQEDLELEKRLHAPDSLSGILNWALTGLRRISTGEKLQNSEAGKAELEEVKAATDSIHGFILDCVEAEPANTARIGVGEVYKEYKTWCAEVGKQPLNKIHFSREFSGKAAQLGARKVFYYDYAGEKKRGYEGMVLKSASFLC